MNLKFEIETHGIAEIEQVPNTLYNGKQENLTWFLFAFFFFLRAASVAYGGS